MYKQGDEVKVSINGKVHVLTADVDGRLRFPHIKLLRLLMLEAEMDYNKLFELVDEGIISEDDRRFVYTHNGYSLNGYCEIFPEDRIQENV